MSRYIGDPDMIDHWLSRPSMGASLGFCANHVKSQRDHTSHAFPGSIPFLADPSPPPPRNTVTG
jgi:hypothetical protein